MSGVDSCVVDIGVVDIDDVGRYVNYMGCAAICIVGICGVDICVNASYIVAVCFVDIDGAGM